MGLEDLGELADATRPQSRTRPAHDIEPEAFDCLCQQVSIATGADQRRAVAVREETPQNRWKYQQPIMPERADVILVHRFSNNAGAIVDLVAQRAPQKLEQAKSKRDQPARAPTFDLQLFFRGVFAASSCQR